MPISITQLRANIYNIVDEVIKTGQPIDIERDGVRLRITTVAEPATAKTSKLSRLITRKNVMVDPPETYVHIDWSDEWNP